LGDSLDGTLARVRRQLRPPYGFYVDHLVDSFGALALMGGLALSGYIHPWIAVGLLVAFLMLSIQSYLATHALGEFRLSFWRFGPTELRILLIVGNLTLLWKPRVHFLRAQLQIVRRRRSAWFCGDGADVGFLLRRKYDPALSRRKDRQVSGTILRWLKFNAVGALGIGVQLAVLLALKSGLHLAYLSATALAVEAAVVHNFLWHERYTWADRVQPSWRHSLPRLLRFNLTTGMFSILGNLALMKVMVGLGQINYLAANGTAIAVCSLANFLLSDGIVFANGAKARSAALAARPE
jgi:putative flippase GtrA